MRKGYVGKISNKRGAVQKIAEECLVNEKQHNGIQIADENSNSVQQRSLKKKCWYFVT